MMCLATFVVFLLIGFSAALHKDVCDIDAAVGENLSISFVFKGLGTSHGLKWSHNNTIIFYKHQGKVSVGKPDDVSATGSLVLKKLQPTSAGVYQAQVLTGSGDVAGNWTYVVCMMEKVSKPKLSFICDFKKKAVNLTCEVAKPQGLDFSWTLDKKTLPSETKQTLSVSMNQPKDQNSFSCSVENKVSKVSSDAIHPACSAPELCFSSQTVVVALAGGAGLIFFLITTIITLCICMSRRRGQKKFKNKECMLSLKKQEVDSTSLEYETMRDVVSDPPDQPEKMTETRPAQLSMAAEGQRRSPVPKPRKKNMNDKTSNE